MFTMITAGDRQHMQYMQHVLLQIHFTSEVFEDETGKWMDIDMTSLHVSYLKNHTNN